MAGKEKEKRVPIDSLRHKDKRRNIPTEELRGFLAREHQEPQTVGRLAFATTQSNPVTAGSVWRTKETLPDGSLC